MTTPADIAATVLGFGARVLLENRRELAQLLEAHGGDEARAIAAFKVALHVARARIDEELEDKHR